MDVSGDTDPEGQVRKIISATLASRVTFASQQNAVPLLRELGLHNPSEEPLAELRVEISSEPTFLVPKSWHVDRIGPGESVNITDLDIALSAGFLWNLKEAVTGSVVFTLTSGADDIASESFTTELLAYNEWGGLDHMPEMVAAFVMPNDPAVEKILKSAAAQLRSHSLSSQIDGYQSDSPRRIGELTTAIWAAIASRGLDYATPPASFELEGQKVRTPTHILDSGLATCLDLTLLFAACLEQAGLNPVLVFTRGHAFVGVWLRDEQFSTITVEDITSLRKRRSLKDALFFETTAATRHPTPKLAMAIRSADEAISEAHEADFRMAIDVHRARMQRIRPLSFDADRKEPAGDHAGQNGESEHQDVFDHEAVDDLPETGHIDRRNERQGPRDPRLDRWQRKLLDLSLRNTLLNFRAYKRSVAIRCPDPGRLEDKLAASTKVKVMPSPHMMDETSGRSAEIHRQRFNEDAEEAYAAQALERNEVIVDLPPTELGERLTNLYRLARAGMQEGGANTLYLALGFLVWHKDDGKSKSKYRAPLILVPVSLERRSVRSGMRLVRHDDESRVNPTLLQMLEQDFALTIPELTGTLPEDDSGLDVRGIWNIVTRAIQDHGGWEVTEEVVLSVFSFAKYLMWKDLVERTETLKQNPLVCHLIESPKEVYPSTVPFPEPRRLDQDYLPEKTFTPLPADSSQLSAIMAAASGKDFVLVGPPGTGKSQTISNMIAQCMGEGRTVLFVSEKTAALDVVYRRLRDVGLGQFCLEMHSNKARKVDVLHQLKQAWDTQSSLDSDAWAKEAGRLAERRSALNAFVERLHHVYPNGLTPYRAIGYVMSGHHVAEVALQWPSPQAHDQDAYEALMEIAGRMDVDGKELGSIADSPFAGVKQADWSPTWQDGLVRAAETTLPVLSSYRKRLEAFAKLLGLEGAQFDKAGQETVVAMASLLPQACGKRCAFGLSLDGARILEDLKTGMALLDERRQALGRLSAPYREEAIGALDIQDLKATWTRSEASWWPKGTLLKGKVAKQLRHAVKDKTKPDCPNDLSVIEEVQRLNNAIGRYDALAGETAHLWAGLDTQTAPVEQTINLIGRIRVQTAAIANTPEHLVLLRENLHRLLGEGNEMLAEEASVGRAAAELRRADAELKKQLSELNAAAGASGADLAGTDGADWLSTLAGVLNGWIEQKPKLRNWCAWRRVREEAVAKALTPLVEAVEAGAVEPGKIHQALKINYARWWIRAVIDNDDVLRLFMPAEHERTIEEFVRLDNEFTQLTRSYIRAKLSGQLPAKFDINRNSEWGVLKREMEKKRRHKPLRQLVTEMPTALTRLTPCLLMSPLSIAQYLPPDQALFDVVIFDEASQIPVWDAVGAIARGKQAVIVGDPKQLPPTNFFGRSVDPDDEDDADTEQDLESILDECLGATIPERHLKWHYRSRHESLIAFSNHRYYHGSLVTFPSPVTDDRAVSYHYVSDGTYARGGARTNQAEAKALVADIIGRIKNPAFARRGPSMGVVTFNSEQQRLIEDLFDAERAKNPSLEQWFSDDALEPIMVKNLESVQGDERDIIYFSVTYGRDVSDRPLSMNFGPLNKSGGERRLNVAITRAREELRVFASIKPEEINLARTQAIGVRDFKHFLEFAMRGPKAMAEATTPTGGDFDSPFEQAVAVALRDLGWEIHPQVGVSNFRVDLGVVHPDAEGTYLAGVECDGATYHRSATARDRDKLREAVLRDKGWEILRVWSIDWWSDREGALIKLDSALNDLLEASRQAREERAASAVTDTNEQAPPASEPANEDTVAATDSEEAEPAAPVEPDQGAPANDSQPMQADHGDSRRIARFAHETSPDGKPLDQPGVEHYREADLASLFGEVINPDRFYDDGYGPVIARIVDSIVEVEGPIRDERLVRRIARAHGFQRTGSRIRRRVLKLVDGRYPKTQDSAGGFIWPMGSDPNAWKDFRRSDPENPRSVDEIALQELNALAGYLAMSGLAHDEAMIRDMARICHISRISAPIRHRLAEAVRAHALTCYR
ncbi:MAG TPA: DUF3320 domain-containing protein [Gammaproteobacteria bacterium]|nr:DUF3320 domain-containing protein [Gammaproteobacteria bacterium]